MSHKVPMISISIVSHNQLDLVFCLLADIERYCQSLSIEILLTFNTVEDQCFNSDSFSMPIKVLKNSVPMGFGANHNQAFKCSKGDYFCVLNPDIRLVSDPFPPLLDLFKEQKIGIAAPLVKNSVGNLEDSIRKFPSPLEILGKVFGQSSSTYIADLDEDMLPDWVAGMFMLFQHDLFSEIGGFDTRYFLYYEDVDICARLRLEGYRVAVCREVVVVHEAQRESHRNFRYLTWHLSSLLRFFTSRVYRKLRKNLKC